MSNYIDDDELDRHGPLVRAAVFQLIANHQDEFDELTGRWQQVRMEELERRISRLTDELNQLRGQNPDGTNVPALTQTANNLVRANDELSARLRKLEQENAKLREVQQRLKEVSEA